MIQRFQRILAVVHAAGAADAALRRAVELARNNQARLEVVDVIPDDRGMFSRFLPGGGNIEELALVHRRERLEAIVEPFRGEAGPIEVDVLHGQPGLEIIRHVLREKHDVVLKSAHEDCDADTGGFGSLATLLMRVCPCPVWIVQREHDRPYQRIAAAVDTLTENPVRMALNHQVLGLAVSLSRSEQGEVRALNACPIYAEDLLRARLPAAEFTAYETATLDDARARLDALAAGWLDVLSPDRVHLLKGIPEVVIPEFVASNRIDILVMGTVARSGLPGFVIGNTAEKILSRVTCSVLTVKPEGFLCPVALPG